MSAQDITRYQMQSKFFIGIDSDGTVFDSMEIKHRKVFQPVAVELWGLQPVESEYNTIAEFINLYSVHRGVNRFQGLAMAFERLAQRPEIRARGVDLPDFSLLRDFAVSGCAPSAAALAEYNAPRSDLFLEQVLEWSRLCDEHYARVTREEGNPAFPGVRDALACASRLSDLMIVSSSNRKALNQDWGEVDLLQFIDLVAGQEAGSKTAQLQGVLRGEHTPSRCLMIGDAPGDLEAAEANGILFYPIVPGRENESWAAFLEEGLERFLNETYEGEYQKKLLDEFSEALCADEVWMFLD